MTQIGESVYCIFEGEMVLLYFIFDTILYYEGEPCLVTITSWNRMTLGYAMHLINKALYYERSG